MSKLVAQNSGILVLRVSVLIGVLTSIIVPCVNAETELKQRTGRFSSVNNGNAFYNFLGSLDQESVPHPRSSNLMWDFMIMKGCQYLMAFIHSSYNINDHTDGHTEMNHDLTCDQWQQWAERRCRGHDIPHELCCAIINCGEDYTAAALSAPHSYMEKCNVTVDGSMMVGKRTSLTGEHFNSYSSTMCPPPGENHLFGRRSTSYYLQSDITNNQNANDLPENNIMDNQFTLKRTSDDGMKTRHANGDFVKGTQKKTEKHVGLRRLLEQPSARSEHTEVRTQNLTNGVQQEFSSVSVDIDNLQNNNASSGNNRTLSIDRKVERWCNNLSWKVNRHYDFNKNAFVRRSKYWVVDTYKVASRRHIPHGVTHSLVGCGIDYVMNAFHVSRWQAYLYSHVTVAD